MVRERLEETLNTLVSEKLTDRQFLRHLATIYNERTHVDSSQPSAARIQDAIQQTKQKRERVMEAYFENLINRAERDRRLAALESESKLYGSLALTADVPARPVRS
jgi:23S rRNA pseudoU1915 N3-methylase RlmH